MSAVSYNDLCEAIANADQQLDAFRNRRALASLMMSEATPRIDAIAAFDVEIAEMQADR
jgi:hypothetical protein